MIWELIIIQVAKVKSINIFGINIGRSAEWNRMYLPLKRATRSHLKKVPKLKRFGNASVRNVFTDLIAKKSTIGIIARIIWTVQFTIKM